MASHLDGHASLDVPRRVFQLSQRRKLVGRIERPDVVRRFVPEERREAVYDFPFVFGILDGCLQGLFPLRRLVFFLAGHVTPRYKND